MNRWGLIASLLLLCTCVKANEPSAGSQTHFLASCDGSCPEPYVCSCGVCTLSCTDDRTCSAQAPNATCSAGPSGEAACRQAPAVCDVECAANRDCAALGLGFSCRDGRCREPAASHTDAGSRVDASTDGGSTRDADTAVVVDATSGTDAGPGADGAAAADPLCDGSEDMRLAVTISGGFVAGSYDFTNPYGHSFLFIDGQCRFFTSSNFMQGIRSGTLGAAQASQIAAALGWSKLEAWSALPLDTACPDSGVVAIRRADFEATCSCGCDPTAPADKAAAFTQIDSWLQTLSAQGEPLTGSVMARAQPRDPPAGGELPWPLARPMASIEGLIEEELLTPRAPPAFFDDPGEAGQLRALRAQALQRNPSAGFVPLSEAGTAYQLYIRDELPEQTAGAIATLLAQILP